jgi:glycosyltransferase involved in cell wall biosynthesis
MQISVYITSFNQKKYLNEAIESILAQTFKPAQIIIIDDASKDNSQEVISGYKSLYPELITAIFHDQNQGVAKTRVDALSAVESDYVTYVDGDDRFLPEKLEKESTILFKNPHADISFSNNFYISEDGHRIGRWIKNKQPPQGAVFCQTFARDYPRNNLFRMELAPYIALKKNGFYDVNLMLLEDWNMRIRLSKQYKTIYLDEPLSEIRIHQLGLSKTLAIRKLDALEYIWAKNKHLLNDLEPREKKYVEEKINEWRARFIRMIAKEKLAISDPSAHDKKVISGLYIQSLKYHRFVDIDLILGCILPKKIYFRLKTAYRNLQNQ